MRSLGFIRFIVFQLQLINQKSVSLCPRLPYCIRNSLLYLPIGKALLYFVYYQLFLGFTVLTVTVVFTVKLFLPVLG